MRVLQTEGICRSFEAEVNMVCSRHLRMKARRKYGGGSQEVQETGPDPVRP